MKNFVPEKYFDRSEGRVNDPSEILSFLYHYTILTCPSQICHITLAIPVVISQNVTNKSCIFVYRVKNMGFWSPLDPRGPNYVTTLKVT